MRLVLLTALLLSTLHNTNAGSLTEIVDSWKNSDNLFSPKLFKFMLMLPTSATQIDATTPETQIHQNYRQTNVKNEDVHVNDVVSELLADYLQKGGPTKNAHVISKDDEVKQYVPRYHLDIKSHPERRQVQLVHGGTPIANLPVAGMNECLFKNAKELGIRMSRNDAGDYIVKSGDMTLSFSEADFAPYKQFLEDVCFMVEYAKVHINNWDNSAVIYHLKSYLNVITSPHSDFFTNVLKNALEMFQKQVVETFGQTKVDFMVSMFKAISGATPKLDRNRVLADAADTGATKLQAGVDNLDFLYSIKVCFGVVFSFVIFYTSVYLYDMDTYKDSLIYAGFISVKKGQVSEFTK